MRARQAFIETTGGPEVIRWRDVDLGAPGPGQVLVRQEAVGLNFIDVYHRSGVYPVDLPAPLGSEGAGVVEAVGSGTEGFAVGDRVATIGPRRGAYASARIVPADELFKLPDAIDTRTAAAAMLKGLTAEMLAERVAPVAAGEWALVHAAAGGVGQILLQWLKARGVRVIATAGSDEKLELVRRLGADAAIPADAADLGDQARALTGGEGARASYDGVGKVTWQHSLRATGRRGIIASFGNASGPVTGVSLGSLAQAGLLFVSRPTLFDYYRDPADRTAGADKLWNMIAGGKVKVAIGQTYPLEQAAQAHRDLEARMTSGSTLLLP